MARRSATFDEIKRKHKIRKLCFMAASQLLDKGLPLTHGIPQLSIIMLIFRPPSSEAFGAISEAEYWTKIYRSSHNCL